MSTLGLHVYAEFWLPTDLPVVAAPVAAAGSPPPS
jgi:hypothetical protein